MSAHPRDSRRPVRHAAVDQLAGVRLAHMLGRIGDLAPQGESEKSFRYLGFDLSFTGDEIGVALFPEPRGMVGEPGVETFAEDGSTCRIPIFEPSEKIGSSGVASRIFKPGVVTLPVLGCAIPIFRSEAIPMVRAED